MSLFEKLFGRRPPASTVPEPGELDRAALRAQLRIDEGVRRFPYTDTVGKLSIGAGRNLTDVGLSDDEIDILLDNDIDRAIASLDKHLPWWRELSEPRQRVLVNMAFNMGIGSRERGLLSFATTLELVRTGRFEDASVNMLRSLWAQQTGQRARRLAEIMRTGRG